MKLKLTLLVVFQLCSISLSNGQTSGSHNKINQQLTTPAEAQMLQKAYNGFPCTNEQMVIKVLNILKVLRTSSDPGRPLEAIEAEMELLYMMIFGEHSENVSLSRWYLIFEKLTDAYDQAQHATENSLKLNELILKNYLTDLQRKQLNVLIRLFQYGAQQSDKVTLFRYLYVTAIGLTLNVPHESIVNILEYEQSMDVVLQRLSKIANDNCTRVQYNQTNEHIATNIMRILLSI